MSVASSVPTLSPKETAVQLRTILRAAFPACRFSVTVGRGAGVSSVSVSWTDGPTRDEVRALTAGFVAGSCRSCAARASRRATIGRVARPAGRPWSTTGTLAPSALGIVGRICETWRPKRSPRLPPLGGPRERDDE